MQNKTAGKLSRFEGPEGTSIVTWSREADRGCGFGQSVIDDLSLRTPVSTVLGTGDVVPGGPQASVGPRWLGAAGGVTLMLRSCVLVLRIRVGALIVWGGAERKGFFFHPARGHTFCLCG